MVNISIMQLVPELYRRIKQTNQLLRDCADLARSKKLKAARELFRKAHRLINEYAVLAICAYREGILELHQAVPELAIKSLNVVVPNDVLSCATASELNLLEEMRVALAANGLFKSAK
jgi:bifunctional ADP-heptose synthase (sugar kinase/adenylyltransferase)